LPTAFAIALAGLEAVVIYKIWMRNKELVDRLLNLADDDDGEDEEKKKKKPATRGDLADASAAMLTAVAANADVVARALGSQYGEQLERAARECASVGEAVQGQHRAELERYHERIEAMRGEIAELNATAREDLKSMNREQLGDLKTLTREMLQTMEAATSSMDKLSALIQGAMRGGGVG
ncbi:MAG TPA: hypothetical protein VIY27_08215, partial [Myxococcota bacterium]